MSIKTVEVYLFHRLIRTMMRTPRFELPLQAHFGKRPEPWLNMAGIFDSSCEVIEEFDSERSNSDKVLVQCLSNALVNE